MTFKEKLYKVSEELARLHSYDYANSEAKVDKSVPYLTSKILGWPKIASKVLGIEDLDTENNEIIVFEDYAHIWAGGDWQICCDLDILLNEDPHTSEKFPFVACNIICGSDLSTEETEEEEY